MTGYEVAVFAAKLAFGTLAFLVIGYIGASNNKRVAGAMLAFPVLNGIGLIASPDQEPAALTAAMMPMVVLNGILFFCFIATFGVLRRRCPGATRRSLSYEVAIAFAAIWFLIGWLLIPWLEPIFPSPAGWVVVFGILVIAATVLLWEPRSSTQNDEQRVAPPALMTFWRQRKGRVAFFVISMFLLLVVASLGTTAWIGRLSALPLVPLCVLAGLAIDDADNLPAVKDAIFLGPWIGMVFVLGFMEVLIRLHPAGELAYWSAAIATLAIGWTACFLTIRLGVPPLAAALDRWRGRAASGR